MASPGGDTTELELRKKTLAELVQEAIEAAAGIGEDIKGEFSEDPWDWAAYEELRFVLDAIREKVGDP